MSRTPFGLDRAPDLSPPGVLTASKQDGAVGVTNASVGTYAAEAGYQPTGAGRGRLSQPDGRRAFLSAGGHFTVYLRVIPVVSTADPRPVGLASPELRLIYAASPPADLKIPSGPPTQPSTPSPVQCLNLKYTPVKEYCYVHPGPSVCAQVGEKAPWYESTFSFLTDAWNWASKTYQAAKKAVVDIAVTALPMVPREAFEYALDGALAACGIPPDLPNLEELMEGGADYLAGELVAQIGPPVAGDLAKAQLKNAIYAGAKAATKKLGDAGPSTPCDYKIDWPYLVVVIRNTTNHPIGPLYVKAADWTGTFASNTWDGRLFKSYGQSVARLNPGASLPVYIPLMPEMRQKKHFVQGVHKPLVYWNDYNSLATEVEVTVAVSGGSKVETMSAKSGKRLFKSPFVVTY